MDVFVASRQITSLVGSFRFSFLISLKAQKYKKKPGKKLIKNCPSFSTFELERSTGQYQTDSTLHSKRFMRSKSKICTPTRPSSLYSLQFFSKPFLTQFLILRQSNDLRFDQTIVYGFRVITQKKIRQVGRQKCALISFRIMSQYILLRVITQAWLFWCK